ncbi:MAG TPA: ATP-binding protein [Acetobacteraceae bacterium]|nr:ATP-binding protein [Acetobacteraceae bacterium]
MRQPARAGSSLSARLAWRLAAVMVLAVGLAGAAVGWRSIATIHSLDDAALQGLARSVARHLVRAPGGGIKVALPPALAVRFRYSDGAMLYLVLDGANHVLAGSDPAAGTLLAPFLPRPPAAGLFQVPRAGHDAPPMVGYLRRDHGLGIVVAQGREQREALVNSLMSDFMVTGLGLLLPIGAAAVLIGVLTIRAGLRPLRVASAAAARVDPANAGMRLPQAGLPREVLPLVSAVNAALARLERGLTVQRRFAGEAAHALRTPLAVLTARLDDLPEGAEAVALRRDADRMARLVDQMLKMARLEGLPLDTSQPVDLRAVAVEAISDLAPLAIRQGIELSLKDPAAPVPVRGNHAALALAAANLIENALAYAPPGSAVEVEIAPPGTLRVLDRGPGVAEPERARIFERFQHGHRPAGTSGNGAGLGLAIVAEIAAAHRGSVGVAERGGGGAVFTLQIGRPVAGG